MAEAVFCDTSAFIAVNDKSDQFHNLAAGFFSEIIERSIPILTTNLVISETYTRIMYRANTTRAVRFLDYIEPIKIIYSTAGLENSARQILRKYNDQSFSYVDAVSFAVMTDYKVKYAFTFDKHFFIAGFTTCPQPD